MAREKKTFGVRQFTCETDSGAYRGGCGKGAHVLEKMNKRVKVLEAKVAKAELVAKTPKPAKVAARPPTTERERLQAQFRKLTKEHLAAGGTLTAEQKKQYNATLHRNSWLRLK